MNNNYFLTSEIVYETIKMIDIFKKFQFKNISTNDFIYYNVKNGETPEIISYNYYGTTDFWWIILLYNEIIDPFYEWPMSEIDLEQYVQDNTTDYQLHPDTYAENLNEAKTDNETNRTIKLPKKHIIDKIKIEIINYYK